MALAQTATVSTTKEIRLAPKLRQKLLVKLSAYASIHAQMKALKTRLDDLKGQIGGLRDETGEQSISLEGFTVTLVAPTYKKFNEKKFIALGGDLELYRQAVEEKPKKAYNKISVPGSKEESDDE